LAKVLVGALFIAPVVREKHSKGAEQTRVVVELAEKTLIGGDCLVRPAGLVFEQQLRLEDFALQVQALHLANVVRAKVHRRARDLEAQQGVREPRPSVALEEEESRLFV
jgi:hypothetical protein